MPNSATYSIFFKKVAESIANGTFAKLTLAKTIGNPELKNIYVRTVIINNTLNLSVTIKSQTEEEVVQYSINEGFFVLTTYLNNPFLSALLFTTKSDITLKHNKKKIANITEQPPTFKNPDLEIIAFYKSKQQL